MPRLVVAFSTPVFAALLIRSYGVDNGSYQYRGTQHVHSVLDQAGQILRPPPGTVMLAICVNSSCVKGGSPPAWTVSWICCALFAPGITVETAG